MKSRIGLLLTVTPVSTTCAAVISTVKVSCVSSVDGIELSFIDLIGQLSCDGIGIGIGRLSVKP